jgi:hypothetical protein
MSNKGVTLTGWKAVPVILLVVGFAGFRWFTARDALDTAGREYMEQWIAMELSGPLLSDETMSLEERGQAVLAARRAQN